MFKSKTLISLGLIAGLFTACGSDSDDKASVRVFHGSPDAPAVDVLVDDERVIQSLSYLQSSDYLDVDAGTRNFKVNAANTTTSVIDVNVPLQEDTKYTVVASNRLANISPLLLVDSDEDPGNNKSNLRVVHNAPSAPAVDVYATAPDADLATAEPVLRNVPFGQVSDYLNVDSGDYQVRVTVAGTKTVAIDTGRLTLEDGVTYTALAVDNAGGGSPFGIQLLIDN
jgi:hypothetical protein